MALETVRADRRRDFIRQIDRLQQPVVLHLALALLAVDSKAHHHAFRRCELLLILVRSHSQAIVLVWGKSTLLQLQVLGGDATRLLVLSRSIPIRPVFGLFIRCLMVVVDDHFVTQLRRRLRVPLRLYAVTSLLQVGLLLVVTVLVTIALLPCFRV